MTIKINGKDFSEFNFFQKLGIAISILLIFGIVGIILSFVFAFLFILMWSIGLILFVIIAISPILGRWRKK